MNIIDYKSQIDSLTSNLVREYNKLEKQYIEGKKSSFNDLNDIIAFLNNTKTSYLYGFSVGNVVENGSKIISNRAALFSDDRNC